MDAKTIIVISSIDVAKPSCTDSNRHAQDRKCKQKVKPHAPHKMPIAFEFFKTSMPPVTKSVSAIKSGRSPKNDCPNYIVYRLSRMKWIAVTQNVKMTNLVMKTWLFINIKTPLLIHCCELFHSDDYSQSSDLTYRLPLSCLFKFFGKI